MGVGDSKRNQRSSEPKETCRGRDVHAAASTQAPEETQGNKHRSQIRGWVPQGLALGHQRVCVCVCVCGDGGVVASESDRSNQG